MERAGRFAVSEFNEPDLCYPVEPAFQDGKPTVVMVIDGVVYAHPIEPNQLRRWIMTLARGINE